MSGKDTPSYKLGRPWDRLALAHGIQKGTLIRQCYSWQQKDWLKGFRDIFENNFPRQTAATSFTGNSKYNGTAYTVEKSRPILLVSFRTFERSANLKSSQSYQLKAFGKFHLHTSTTSDNWLIDSDDCWSLSRPTEWWWLIRGYLLACIDIRYLIF